MAFSRVGAASARVCKCMACVLRLKIFGCRGAKMVVVRFVGMLLAFVQRFIGMCQNVVDFDILFLDLAGPLFDRGSSTVQDKRLTPTLTPQDSCL